MKLSYNWLKELTKTKTSSEKMAELLNLQVASVEGITDMAKCFEQVVVAEILEIKKHPQADKLQLVKVKTGNLPQAIHHIVCGAFNIKVGDKVPLALVGAILPNGMEIKEAVIRGQKSAGMLCAEDELGLGHDHSGILILDKKTKVGEKFAKVLGLDDVIFEIETVALTHRPDLFGHLGFAREVAALTNSKLQIPSHKLKSLKTADTSLKIKVENSKDCPRYMAVVMDNIKIEPSPAWLQNRLRNLGIRPINNVVDVTNAVLLEVGQPLHAFDFNKLSGGTTKSKIINIRRAQDKEKILALDGVARELSKDILVIADGEKPVALAGIMGGEHSGIAEETKTIVIESANFDSVVIRRGAKKVGLRTEANLRFEKNLPLIFTEQGIVRAIELMQQLCRGKVVSTIYDITDKTIAKQLKTKQVINLDKSKIFDLIGEKISEAQIIKYLNALGFVSKKSGAFLKAIIPAHRRDIEYPEDIIEEIARLYGYQKITPQPVRAAFEVVKVDPLLKLEKNLKNALVDFGFDELYNYSFYGEKTINFFKLKKDEHLTVANPLNPDQQFLRISLLSKLLEKAAENNPLFDAFKIFEIGHVYKKNDVDFEEQKHLGGLVLEKNPKMFFLTKGYIEAILENIGIKKNRISYKLSQHHDYQYLENFTGVLVDSQAIGLFGLVNRKIKDSLKIKAEVGLFELNLETLTKFSGQEKLYQKISAYPAVMRDLALLVAKSVKFEELHKLIASFNPLITLVEPFDVFESEKLGKDTRSVAFHLTFQSFDRTLVSQEIDKIIADLVKTLEQKFQAKLRNF